MLRRLRDHLADRIHARGDAAATAAGLTVTRLPGGGRRISHPDLPALLEARRLAAIRDGLDDADRALIDPATIAALAATRHNAGHPAPLATHFPSVRRAAA